MWLLLQGIYKGQQRCIYTDDPGYLACVVRFLSKGARSVYV